MNEKLAAMKAAIAAFLSAVGVFLGWRTILLLVWVALMGLDYLSGTLAARKLGQWRSNLAREGIFHKAGMILVVLVSMLTDFVILLALENLPVEAVRIHWPMVLFPMVTMWYILTETGSILENAISMGASVPAWLPRLLNATLNSLDSAVSSEDTAHP